MLIHDYLQFWSAWSPDSPCIEDGTRAFTYREVDEAANRFAQVLAHAGIAPGERISVLAKNDARWAGIYYGAFRAGVVPVPLNFRLHPSEWRYQLEDSGVRLVVGQDVFVPRLEPVLDGLPIVTRLALDAQDLAGWSDLDETVSGFDATPPQVALTSSADLYQMYTSGTTGAPKGAVISHGAANANLMQIRTVLPLAPGEGTLLTAPLFHAAAAVSLFWYVASGASTHIQTDFDPAACVEVLDTGGVVSATFVPVMLQMLLQVAGAEERDYHGLRNVIYGASPIGETTLRKVIEVFECDVIQGYGQTECCSALTFLGADEHRQGLEDRPELLASAGRPVVGTQIRIVDPESRLPCPAGIVGEIEAAGPQLMSGYWNLPDQTADTLVDGWIRTGDAGYLDDDGYLFISDRVKDLIVSGGENIYPRQVEEIISTLDGVADCAVIGVPDDEWGETVKAVVVVSPEAALTEQDVVDHARSHLAGFKCPRSVDFIGELPRNATGKVLKTMLREPYWKGHTRRVAG